MTPTPLPKQDRLAEIEERYDIRPGGTEPFDIVYEDYWWLIEEVKRLRGDNATLSSYIYSMTNPGTLPEVLRGSMQRAEQ